MKLPNFNESLNTSKAIVKHLLFTVLLIVLCSNLGLSQKKKTVPVAKKETIAKRVIPTTPNDVKGWENLTWGISKNDLPKSLSQYPLVQNGRVAQAMKEPTLVCDKSCILFNYNVDGELLDVFFKFDDNTNGLIEVFITDANRKLLTPSLKFFDNLEDKFVLKYGVYKSQSDNKTDMIINRTRQWIFPSTIIELEQTYLGEDSGLIKIIFRPSVLSK